MAICSQVRARFEAVRAQLDRIKALVPPERYYRYKTTTGD